MDIIGTTCAGLPLLVFAVFTALYLLAGGGILDEYEDILAVSFYSSIFLSFLGGIYNLIRSIQRSWLGIAGLAFNGITIALIAWAYYEGTN